MLEVSVCILEFVPQSGVWHPPKPVKSVLASFGVVSSQTVGENRLCTSLITFHSECIQLFLIITLWNQQLFMQALAISSRRNWLTVHRGATTIKLETWTALQIWFLSQERAWPDTSSAWPTAHRWGDWAGLLLVTGWWVEKTLKNWWFSRQGMTSFSSSARNCQDISKGLVKVANRLRLNDRVTEIYDAESGVWAPKTFRRSGMRIKLNTVFWEGQFLSNIWKESTS